MDELEGKWSNSKSDCKQILRSTLYYVKRNPKSVSVLSTLLWVPSHSLLKMDTFINKLDEE